MTDEFKAKWKRRKKLLKYLLYVTSLVAIHISPRNLNNYLDILLEQPSPIPLSHINNFICQKRNIGSTLPQESFRSKTALKP